MSVTLIHRLSSLSRADLATAGGKGANLGELMRLGLSVPPGFVVSARAYAEQAREWGLAERISAHLAVNRWEAAASEVAALFEKGEMLPTIESAVRDAHRELGASRVAVRSSATAEDLADASFAGQHETFLDVAGEDDLLLALRRCWASLWSPRALRYRAARHIDHLEVNIAVVVQRMVPADFAGVLFTVDPVVQRADRMLLELAPGLGEAVVSGHTTGDVYRLRREPLAGPTGSGGEDVAEDVAIEDRDRREASRPAPSDAMVLALARLGLRLENHFGCPQDVEFAFEGSTIHLLQSRPITTLYEAEIEPLPPSPKLNRMQQRMVAANDDDRFPVAPKPLDQWGFRMVIPALIHTMRFLGAEVDATEERAMLDQVWREMLVMPQPHPTLRLLGLPGKVAASLRHDWMAWWEAEAFKRIQEACARVDIRALDDAALLGRADRIVQVTTEVLSKRFEGIVSQLAAVALRIPVTVAVGRKRAGTVMGDLVSGLHTRTSDVNLALFQLARRAASAGPDVSRPIREGRPEDLRASVVGRAYLAEVEAFLDEHGHRETTGFYLSAPTWRQDPTPMWALLRGLLDTTEPPSEEASLKRYRAALEEVTHKLRFVPGLPGSFERTLEQLRKAIIYRERSHFDLARSFSAMQAVVADIARRLHERGQLPTPDDIFYLTEAEVRAWLRGSAPPLDEVKRLVRRRRATYGVVNGRWQKRAFQNAASASGNELRGTGASSGVVRGMARIVRSEHEFERLKAGEILVCRYTNPSWTPLFNLAAGVVTDVGGAASHAAIVAREYGVPAVLGAAGATTRIVDGQEILVDGTEGRVTLLGPAATGEVDHG
ncbi:PEP/pyruvate-binding domain-containing protein [Chondromyces apiculatus]|uniref:Phosphoenolpyruvate synthase n=1 Tax=Chondromyces apiculatus DSM 436 TaxID=1192034 RepID=A0A017TEL2_9BACT|nr:PEP/pyruvate-binding domain-containing protein [Chondromyces apiculatus]EYF07265.1 Phosphoenolpyruvate synthase [Chondromyces apiculatus DSM 436]